MNPVWCAGTLHYYVNIAPPRPPPVWENDQEHIYLTRLLSYVGKFICQICNMFPCLCSNSWSDNFIKMKDKYLAWPTQPILMSLRNTPFTLFTYSPKVRSFPNRCLSTSHHWFRYMTLTIRCKYCVHIAPTLQKISLNDPHNRIYLGSPHYWPTFVNHCCFRVHDTIRYVSWLTSLLTNFDVLDNNPFTIY